MENIHEPVAEEAVKPGPSWAAVQAVREGATVVEVRLRVRSYGSRISDPAPYVTAELYAGLKCEAEFPLDGNEAAARALFEAFIDEWGGRP